MGSSTRRRPTVALLGLGLVLASLVLGSPALAEDVVETVITDALGNIRVITDDKGNVLERHDYLPFGEECLTGPCAANPAVGGGQPRKFTGKERDQETGLDYFGARYYGSQIGRFTTVDPRYNWNANLVDPQRWNRYAYGRNNPLRYVDPDGKDVFDILGGAITAFGSNLALGANRPEPYNQDFRTGQAIGDAASVIAGGYEFTVGSGLAGLGLATSEIGVGVPVAAAGVAVGAHGLGVSSSGLIHLSKNGTLSPGEHAGQSIPARGPQRDFRAGERADVNRFGGESGCHTCGANQPGTKSGNFVPDHQPPTKVNKAGDSQRLYPHCINCSRQQGGEVSAAVRKEQ